MEQENEFEFSILFDEEFLKIQEFISNLVEDIPSINLKDIDVSSLVFSTC